MARVIITTSQRRRYYKKPSALLVTPYEYNEGLNEYYLGNTTYDLYSIIGDTISITQDDNSSTYLENEFTPMPVIANATMGKWHFSATCLDSQNAVMKAIYDVKFGKDSNGDVVDGLTAFNDDLHTIYCCIQVVFSDDNMSTIVLPKVALNSTFNLANLKSSFLQNKITGDILATNVCVVDTEGQAVHFESDEEQSYAPRVPLMFVPKGKKFGVLRDEERENNYYYMSMFDDDEVWELDGNSGVMQLSV